MVFLFIIQSTSQVQTAEVVNQCLPEVYIASLIYGIPPFLPILSIKQIFHHRIPITDNRRHQ